MITVYDLESFSTIEAEEPAMPEAMGDPALAAELRLQPVSESSFAQSIAERDYAPVIAAQALAKLSA